MNGARTFEFKPGAAASPKLSKRAQRAPPPTATTLSAADLRASQTFTNKNQVITLINPFSGRVAAVNLELRFVVLDFSLSRLPAVDQRLNVYRHGQKVGEVKITGPELNNNLVADLLAGEAQSGDEVRDN